MRLRKILGCFMFGLVILCMGAIPAFAAKDSITYAIDSKFASMERYSSTQTFANKVMHCFDYCYVMI